MISKNEEIFFFDCNASVKVESDSDTDSIIFSITELVETKIVETKISDNQTSYKEVDSTEIYIGPNEARQIINALENVVTESDES